MKRILTLLLAVIMMLSLFASCANDNNTPADTTTTPTETAEPESPFKIPEGKSKRQMCIDYMYAMSEIKWTPANNVHTKQSGMDLSYTKGKVYTGIPYKNLDCDVDLEDFTAALTWNEEKQIYVYETAHDINDTLGNDCSSTVLGAWKLFDTNMKGTTTALFPLGDKYGVYPVGEYETKDYKTSDEICKNNTANTLYEAYAKLQPGDAVIHRDSAAGHIRMVTSVNIVTSASGEKINGSKSYITTVEQTNQFDSTRKDGVNTTWWMEHKYTFSELNSKTFIPITCKGLADETFAEQKVTTQGLNTTKTIGNANSLIGTVSCNYPIQKIIIDVKGKDGTEVFHFQKKPLAGTFNLGTIRLNMTFSTLPAGDYYYSIVISTVLGEGEIYHLDFTK